MKIKSIRRMIVHEAGGGAKLGWFSWAAAIFGVCAILFLGIVALYQFATSW